MHGMKIKKQILIFSLTTLSVVRDDFFFLSQDATICLHDIQQHTVKNFSITYRRRIAQHPNRLTQPLIQGPSYPRRLKRKHSQDLQTTA
jgi:hypothetical protein